MAVEEYRQMVADSIRHLDILLPPQGSLLFGSLAEEYDDTAVYFECYLPVVRRHKNSRAFHLWRFGLLVPVPEFVEVDSIVRAATVEEWLMSEPSSLDEDLCDYVTLKIRASREVYVPNRFPSHLTSPSVREIHFTKVL